MLPYQIRDQFVDLDIKLGTVLSRPGNNQRRASLVYKNGIYFVDNSEMELPLDLVISAERHVIAKIIKTVLIIGPIDNIAGIRLSLGFWVLTRHGSPHCQPQEFINLTHPLSITAGQVIVYCDNVDGLATDNIEIHRQSSNKGFPFACSHLSNLPLVKNHAADQLDIEVAHIESPLRDLSHDGK